MEITVLNRQRGCSVDRAALGGFLSRLSDAMPAHAQSLALCLVGDRRMRELNARFRGVRRTTDVLSFPAGEDPAPDGTRHLGDIVISVPRAAAQAREAGHALARELQLLALHGYLHLLGYDHETDDGEMMRLQRGLARRLLGGDSGARAQ